MLEKNTVYNGWHVLDVQNLADFKSTGLWLRHQKTGMEIFHLFNDDEENLFSFGFKTLPKDSKGTPHIIEHSVLAGSKHYPLKDPFVQLCNQSVKTFLNALTYSDKTLYPASSIAESDYFNLMSVYGDAVFFPLLDKKIFEQEGHHLEIDDDGNLCIQGVVYNEMKGAFSEFNRALYAEVFSALWPSTVYSVDSGGDPLEIPSLSYDEFRAFHKSFYSPANCRLFLYGNIETKKQLDFLNKNFLTSFDTVDKSASDKDCYTLNECSQTVFKTAKGPAGDKEKGSTVIMSWHLGESSDVKKSMEAMLLSEILLGNDSSPLSKALIDSGLGDDLHPWRDCILDEKWIAFPAGLRGVKEGDAKKIHDFILETLQNLVKDGISNEHIESAIMVVDFEHREVTRDWGPYAIKLMDQIYHGWMNGTDPFTPLFTREAFAQIKKEIATNPSYITNLIDTYLLKNTHRCCVTIVPDSSFTEDMHKKEKLILDSLVNGMNENEKKTFFKSVKENQIVLKEFQQSKEKPENLALIPHLALGQLKTTVNKIKTDKMIFGEIPVFIHNQATNGVVYVSAAIPVDVLDPSDYLYLPLYSAMLTNTGWNGKTWAESEAEAAKVLAALSAKPYTSSLSPTQRAKVLSCGENKDIMGRDWLFVNTKMLHEKSKEALQILFECLSSADFTDTARLKDMLIKMRNGIDNAVMPSGYQFATTRALSSLSRTKAIDELWNGLSQLNFLHSFDENNLRELSCRLQNIQEKLSHAGILYNITADDKSLGDVVPFLEKKLFLQKAPIAPLERSLKDFFSLTIIDSQDSLGGENAKKIPYTRYIIPSGIGFAASCCMCASPFGTKESVAETILAHFLTNGMLYEKIRTVGGAYGAFNFIDSFEKRVAFATYRDPNPDNSIRSFIECLEESAKINLDTAQMERLITGCYSKLVQPRSPQSNGFTGFIRTLYGICDEDREENLSLLLSAKPQDIADAAQRLLKHKHDFKSVVLSGEKEGYAGKIVKLPL